MHKHKIKHFTSFACTHICMYMCCSLVRSPSWRVSQCGHTRCKYATDIFMKFHLNATDNEQPFAHCFISKVQFQMLSEECKSFKLAPYVRFEWGHWFKVVTTDKVIAVAIICVLPCYCLYLLFFTDFILSSIPWHRLWTFDEGEDLQRRCACSRFFVRLHILRSHSPWSQPSTHSGWL